jgi:hypothetical protein
MTGHKNYKLTNEAREQVEINRQQRMQEIIDEMNSRILENKFILKEDLIECQVLDEPEYKNTNFTSNYILSVEVGRYEGKSVLNLMVAKMYETRRDIVNLTSFVGLTFSQQKEIINKFYIDYKAAKVILNRNGLGLGLLDQFTDQEREGYIIEVNSLPSNNDNVIVGILKDIENKSLRFLKPYDKEKSKYKGILEFTDEIKSLLETDLLIYELDNLLLNRSSNGQLVLKKNNTDIGLSRFHCLFNLYWYVVN